MLLPGSVKACSAEAPSSVRGFFCWRASFSPEQPASNDPVAFISLDSTATKDVSWFGVKKGNQMEKEKNTKEDSKNIRHEREVGSGRQAQRS
jgi:hypothetical protein